jgi:hypothetical protein
MPRLSFPQRAVWPRLLPGFSSWSGVVGVVLSAISLIVTGISDLDWWIRVGICLLAFVVPIPASAIWKYANIVWQRVKQYDLLYDGFENAASNNQQLQENFTLFVQIVVSAGLQVFEVTGITWGNISPLVGIVCNQQGLLGRKLVVINISTLGVLGRFEIVQAELGGYLAREDRIVDAVWWGFLHNKVARYGRSRIVGAVAILLH